jgi:hypothetical protein
MIFMFEMANCVSDRIPLFSIKSFWKSTYLNEFDCKMVIYWFWVWF